MLQIKNLHASIEDKDILKGINLEIQSDKNDEVILEAYNNVGLGRVCIAPPAPGA